MLQNIRLLVMSGRVTTDTNDALSDSTRDKPDEAKRKTERKAMAPLILFSRFTRNDGLRGEGWRGKT